MCKKSWIKVHHTKKDQFLFSSLWSAMQFFLHHFFRTVFYSVANPQYKLVLLLEKYLFLCKYPPEDILCQNATIQLKQKLLMICKDNNSNIHFIINDFNSWIKDGKDEYFIRLILLQTNVLLRQSLASIWAASVTRSISYRAKRLCLDGQRTNSEKRGWWDCTTLRDHHHPNNSIDLFCYKIYMFPHENISNRLVFSADGYCC